MVQKISLKQAERKVFRATLQDGLWDIFIGCVVLQFAIAPLLSGKLGDFWSSAVFLPFWALVFGVVRLVKKTVIAPRLGSVKFGPARKNKLTKFSIVMIIGNLVAFILGIAFVTHFDVSSGLLHMATLGFLVLVLASVSSYFLESPRLFIYGLLFVLSIISGEWLFTHFRIAHHGYPITFGLTSGIIIMTGVVLFLRLLQQHPIPTGEPIFEEQSDD